MALPSPLPGTSQVESRAVAEHLLCAHRLLNTPLGVKQGLCGIIGYVSHALKERSDSHIPKFVSTMGRYEDGYVEQLPRHVAAPLGHVGLNPFVGGASADTRLVVQCSVV